MPGLRQLKQFNLDLLSIGDEPRILAARAEKPVAVPIPKGVKDEDDSDDFIVGLPDLEEDNAPVKEETSPSDEDFSDITGVGKADVAPDASASPALDLTSILNPIADDTSSGDNMPPDLSSFAEPVYEEEETEEEAEPEPPSIADLGLDDLLKHSGFDMDEFADTADEGDFNFMEDLESDSKPVKDIEPETEIAGAPELDFLSDMSGKENTGEPNLDFLNDMAESMEDQSAAAEQVVAEEIPEPAVEATSIDEIFEPAAEPIGTEEIVDTQPETVSTENIFEPDFSSAVAEATTPSVDNLSISDNDFSFDGFEDSGESIDMSEGLPDDVAERDAGINVNNEQDVSDIDLSFDTSDLDKPSDQDFDIGNDFEIASDDSVPSENDFDTSFAAENIPASDEMPDFDNTIDTDAGADANLDFNLDDVSLAETNLDVDSLLVGLGGAEQNAPDAAASEDMSDTEKPDDGGDESFDMSADISVDIGGMEPPEAGTGFGTDNLAADVAPETGEFNVASLLDGLDADAESGSEVSFDTDGPIEQFDTSEMEGLDFSIQATDAQMSGESDSGDIGEFEIPGFSDIDIVPDAKKAKSPVVSPVQSKGKGKNKPKDVEEEVGDNELTDEQYEKFLKNLSGYPLNVRIAVEDLLVKNEFTDDAEFEVIKKVLSKVPARQLAGHLEKMLDISISVPRDFERRSAAEYEAIKASFQYQLKNRIIPAAIVCVVASAVLFGLFQFGYRIVYKPLMANKLYKRGYVLIQSNDYPQSEILFENATKYALQKNWFYKYAQSYREHRQYVRAEKMYMNILNVFRHDKQAGLEYADMETRDLANYEKAEQILRRNVLDYHVNDADALLALGDVFLEWATERDSDKFEDAKTQYASLIELYGQKDLYLSRMMRYFVRTDNLREVLPLKEHFISQKKNTLSGPDWTELSGYLLDKLFGYLSPSDEYLRSRIEDVREMLVRAVNNDTGNPVALYNMSRYYIYMHNGVSAKAVLQKSIDAFQTAVSLKMRDVYKYIDSYRLLGELYIDEKEYLKAQETYTDGISLYQYMRDTSGLEGNEQIGTLFADMGDIDYFISGNNDNAYRNYIESVKLGNDTPEIQYKIGFIQYYRQDFTDALSSFLHSADGAAGDDNLLLAIGNTLSLRGNNYAAEGYYSRLMSQLEAERAQREVMLPQVSSEDAEFVEMMMRASNNYGVALFNLASQTGSSARNAAAMVQLSLSMRAWDALTRNQETFLRIGGSNLAEQNMGYMSRPLSKFEPAIYTDLPRTLTSDEGIGR